MVRKTPQAKPNRTAKKQLYFYSFVIRRRYFGLSLPVGSGYGQFLFKDGPDPTELRKFIRSKSPYRKTDYHHITCLYPL